MIEIKIIMMITKVLIIRTTTVTPKYNSFAVLNNPYRASNCSRIRALVPSQRCKTKDDYDRSTNFVKEKFASAFPSRMEEKFATSLVVTDGGHKAIVTIREINRNPKTFRAQIELLFR